MKLLRRAAGDPTEVNPLRRCVLVRVVKFMALSTPK